MRRGAALLMLGLLASGPGEAAPLRVMSMNECADQIVLMLLPPARITSVSWLSRDPASSPMAAAAARVGVNRGLAEEVLRQKPDLVITGSFSTGATRALLARLGTPMLTVPPAEDFAGIASVTRTIAAAVGEQARGEALLAGMNDDLARLRALPPLGLRVAAWSGSGFDAGPGSLYDTLIRTAGAANIGLPGRGAPDPERLLALAPDVLLVGDVPEHGTHAAIAEHPVIRRVWAGRELSMSPRDTMCGTPLSTGAALRLRAALEAKARRKSDSVGVAR